MEDDEDIQSQASEESGSPSAASHGSNGRISVTVASHAPSHKNLTLALPIQQQQSRPTTGNSGGAGGGGGGGGGREDCWSEGATGILIDAWGERYLELSRGNLKQKHWKDVSDIVSNRDDYNKPPKTDIQCKNRIDTVKKKYKMEKAKMAAGNGPSKWPFFHKLDQLIGSRAKTGPTTAGSGGAGPSIPFSGNQRVPVGILMGARSAAQPMRSQLQQHKPPVRKRFRAEWDQVSEPEASPEAESADEFQPETYERKRPRIQRDLGGERIERNRGRDEGEKGNGKEKNWGNSLRELTRAILKFGEVYEQAESSKLQQLVDMEKQRMKFAKELEMQRMKSFMETQMELSQLNHRRLGTGLNHHCSNNRATNNDDLSESSD